MSETSEIVSPLVDALNSIPYVWARRIHSGTVKVRGGYMRLGESGAPDVLAIIHGSVILFEAKTEKGLVSEVQLLEHGRIRRAGGDVHVVRSVRQAINIVRAVLKEKGERACG